jgi:hypothetical protein
VCRKVIFASSLNPLDFIEGNFVAGLNPYQLDLVEDSLGLYVGLEKARS